VRVIDPNTGDERTTHRYAAIHLRLPQTTLSRWAHEHRIQTRRVHDWFPLAELEFVRAQLLREAA
jgi:hypothetical protein